MKKLIIAGILGLTAITSQAQVKITKAQATDIKLGVEMHTKAARENNPPLSCIYYRTALLQLKSVENLDQNWKDTVARVRDSEQSTCKKAGVALPRGTF